MNMLESGPLLFKRDLHERCLVFIWMNEIRDFQHLYFLQ